MQIGLTIWLDRPLEETVELAVAAEAAGFGEVWLPDHYFLRDAYVAQALMVERTTGLRFGTAVVSPLLRHPALLASSTATINELSSGRTMIGIGPGGFEFPLQLQIPLEQPLELVRDAVQVVRTLFSGEGAYRGEKFAVVGGSLGRPTGGSIPVYMAARGPRMLELAGEIADGAITHGMAPTYLSFARERIAAGAARVGRSPDACELCLMFDVELDDDETAALDRLRPRCSVMAGGGYAEELIPIFGLDREEVMPLRAVVAAGDLDAATSLVTDSMVDAFGLAGPAEKLVDRLQMLASKGVKRAVLNVGAGSSLSEAVERIRHAGEAVRRVRS